MEGEQVFPRITQCLGYFKSCVWLLYLLLVLEREREPAMCLL